MMTTTTTTNTRLWIIRDVRCDVILIFNFIHMYCISVSLTLYSLFPSTSISCLRSRELISILSCRNSFPIKDNWTNGIFKIDSRWYLWLVKCCWQCVLLNYIIHLSLAVWKPLKTNGLSRVNAPTAPNCKKGPVACQEDDTHVKNTCERRQVSVKKQTIKKPSVSIRHTFKFWESDPDCTRSERGTVGHSRCHLRLIPVTPKAMKITPRNKKICVERKSKYMTFINLNNLNRWCIFWKKLHSWMFTIPCEANVSRVVLVRQLGTVQRAVMNDFFIKITS